MNRMTCFIVINTPCLFDWTWTCLCYIYNSIFVYIYICIISLDLYIHLKIFFFVVSSLATDTVIICEYDYRTIKCPDDQLIEILNANYGRTSSRPCAWGTHQETNCTLPSAIDIARDRCNGKNECELVAKSGMWQANPCPGIIKYVEVKYICNEIGPSGEKYL